MKDVRCQGTIPGYILLLPNPRLSQGPCLASLPIAPPFNLLEIFLWGAGQKPCIVCTTQSLIQHSGDTKLPVVPEPLLLGLCMCYFFNLKPGPGLLTCHLLPLSLQEWSTQATMGALCFLFLLITALA